MADLPQRLLLLFSLHKIKGKSFIYTLSTTLYIDKNAALFDSHTRDRDGLAYMGGRGGEGGLRHRQWSERHRPIPLPKSCAWKHKSIITSGVEQQLPCCCCCCCGTALEEENRLPPTTHWRFLTHPHEAYVNTADPWRNTYMNILHVTLFLVHSVSLIQDHQINECFPRFLIFFFTCHTYRLSDVMASVSKYICQCC